MLRQSEKLIQFKSTSIVSPRVLAANVGVLSTPIVLREHPKFGVHGGSSSNIIAYSRLSLQAPDDSCVRPPYHILSCYSHFGLSAWRHPASIDSTLQDGPPDKRPGRISPASPRPTTNILKRSNTAISRCREAGSLVGCKCQRWLWHLKPGCNRVLQHNSHHRQFKSGPCVAS